MHVEPRHSKDEPAALIERVKNAKVATRLRAVLLVARTRGHKEIAENLSVSPRSVQERVRRSDRAGVEGVRDRPRPGPGLAPPHDRRDQGHRTPWIERKN